MRNYRFVIIFLLTGLICGATVDPFYLKVFNEGKQFYARQQYKSALENFKIAEFGLLQDKALLHELYLYSSLSHFKLNQFDDARDILKKYQEKMDIEDISSVTPPEEISLDVKTMFRSISLGDSEPSRETKSFSRQPAVRHDFSVVFERALKDLHGKNILEYRNRLKKLKKMNRKDPRIGYLEGIEAFKEKKYADCIHILWKVYPVIVSEWRESTYYYLVLSLYFNDNFGQAMAFYYKIKDPLKKKQLYGVISKVIRERNRSVRAVAREFSPKKLEETVRRFLGDQYLCTDILDESLKFDGSNPRAMIQVIRECLKHHYNYNREFLYKASSYLEKKANLKIAVGILQENKYYRSGKGKEAELYYRLGELYFKLENYKKAMFFFRKVKGIQGNYKKIDEYVDIITKTTHNS